MINLSQAFVREGGQWHLIVAAKRNVTSGATDLFGQNCELLHLRSQATDGGPGGPYVLVGVFAPHFRLDLKRLGPEGTIGSQDTNGTLLMLTTGNTQWSQTEPGTTGFAGFGIKFMAAPSGYASGDFPPMPSRYVNADRHLIDSLCVAPSMALGTTTPSGRASASGTV